MKDDHLSKFYEKIIESDILFEGKVFTVEKAQVKLIDDTNSIREVVHHNGGACVLALDAEQNIYLVKQYRISVKQDMLEIPAGKLEKDEDYLLCAQRELKEELGISAKNWELLTEFYPTPGYCSEKIKIFLARNLTIGENKLDPGEFLEVKKLSFDDALEKVYANKITDSKTMLAILLTDKILREEETGVGK
ncbi:MAG: NUDIX hydrolase [Clostridiaceae bacterium]|nr:NUDIX hydrolase [Clostridiaceae bacterium]